MTDTFNSIPTSRLRGLLGVKTAELLAMVSAGAAKADMDPAMLAEVLEVMGSSIESVLTALIETGYLSFGDVLKVEAAAELIGGPTAPPLVGEASCDCTECGEAIPFTFTAQRGYLFGGDTQVVECPTCSAHQIVGGYQSDADLAHGLADGHLDVSDIILARALFRRYCANAANVNYEFKPVPDYDDLPARIRCNWVATAVTARSGGRAAIAEASRIPGSNVRFWIQYNDGRAMPAPELTRLLHEFVTSRVATEHNPATTGLDMRHAATCAADLARYLGGAERVAEGAKPQWVAGMRTLPDRSGRVWRLCATESTTPEPWSSLRLVQEGGKKLRSPAPNLTDLFPDPEDPATSAMLELQRNFDLAHGRGVHA